MKLREIHELAVKMGVEKDPRGKEEIERILAANREKYEKLPEKEKRFFDLESLENPFPDSRILVGDPETEVRCALAGIDMEVPEVLLADRLREKGEPVDLIISHHPEGRGLVNLDKVMALQADEWYRHGVPINIGEALIGKRMQEIYRAFLPRNHERALDAARLLGIPFMSMHTVADNQVHSYLGELFARRKPHTVGDVVDILLEIPEYQASAESQAGPVVIVGKKENRAGKVMVDMTGGTEGPQEVLEKLAAAGVGTIVAMHYSEKHREEAEKQKINVIIAGHIVSDSLGMNLILDRLEERGVRIIPVSGLVRVSRAASRKRPRARGIYAAGLSSRFRGIHNAYLRRWEERQRVPPGRRGAASGERARRGRRGDVGRERSRKGLLLVRCDRFFVYTMVQEVFRRGEDLSTRRGAWRG